tara:strand:+ start:264 stop:425 length:162 start_codon:yes stop_codon:yes gene_type:complete
MKLRKTKFTKVKQAVWSNNDQLTAQVCRIEGNNALPLSTAGFKVTFEINKVRI